MIILFVLKLCTPADLCLEFPYLTSFTSVEQCMRGSLLHIAEFVPAIEREHPGYKMRDFGCAEVRKGSAA